MSFRPRERSDRVEGPAGEAPQNLDADFSTDPSTVSLRSLTREDSEEEQFACSG
jgi:hypothetical protein